jgi:DNA-binding NarL/FixJ family response regulator
MNRIDHIKASQLPTIYMVDDNLSLREMLEFMVEDGPLGIWKGGAGSLAEARDWLSRNAMPDILLLDVRLPDGKGWELFESLSATATEQSAVAFTTSVKDESTMIHVVQKRVKGYIDKGTTRLDDWRAAIRRLADGDSYFSPGILSEAKFLTSKSDHWSRILSVREVQLVRIIGLGLSNAEAGLKAGISAQTVQVHRKNVMKKLGLHRTIDLLNWSRKNGFAE